MSRRRLGARYLRSSKRAFLIEIKLCGLQADRAGNRPGRFGWLLCTLLTAACGGGGGGGGGSADSASRSSGDAQGSAATNQVDSVVASPSLSFTTSAATVSPGGSVTLSWQSSHARNCEASGGWSGGKALAGSEVVGPLEQSQSFTLSCSGDGGGTMREITVNVAGEISVTLNSDVEVVLMNGQANLSWQAVNAEHCEAGGAWNGQQPLSGSFTTLPLTQASTYRITCFAQGDSAVAMVTVQVTDKTLRWQAPTENVDGTPLTDLAGFNVYWGTSTRSYAGSQSVAADVREWEISLGSGIYYLALTALDAESNESAYSNEVRKIIP